MIVIDLSKQQVLDAGPKAKRKPFKCFTKNCESTVNLFYFNIK